MPQKAVTLPPSRARVATVLRAAKDVISIDLVAKALSIEGTSAAKLLSRWSAQGWMRRIGRGLYVPVPLDLAGNEQVVADPWVLVPALFGPCYIGGWTAAHHWDLTEQLFNETVVFTTKRVDAPRIEAQGVTFLPRHVASKHMFGLKTIWRGATRVQLSDPARTVIDMLAAPATGGGIDHVAECLVAFAKSKGFDRKLLIAYAQQYGNGAIFKRLGFLSETLLRDGELAAACSARLTKGYAILDPALRKQRLVTAWNLWVPERWKDRR